MAKFVDVEDARAIHFGMHGEITQVAIQGCWAREGRSATSDPLDAEGAAAYAKGAAAHAKGAAWAEG